MATISELRDLLIVRLSDWADKPNSADEISDEQLVALLVPETGPLKARAVVDSLLNDGLLRQVGDEPITFAPTEALFRLAEGLHSQDKLNAPEVSSNLSFAKFRDALLCVLAERDQNEGPNFYDLKETADKASLHYLPGWVSKAAYYFRDEGLIKDAFSMGGGDDGDGNLDSELTAQGLELAQELINQKAESDVEVKTRALPLYGRIGDGPMVDQAGGAFTLGSSSLGGVPAADRYVKIDHNAPAYTDAVASLDDAIKLFREDHRLDNELGAEKTALVKILEGGKALLDDVKIRLELAVDSIIKPLKRIVTKYDQGLVAVAATKALDLLTKLLGIT